MVDGIQSSLLNYFTMKTIKINLLCLLLLSGIYYAQAQDVNFAELGKRIATTSASIKPGNVVVIYGGKHTIDLMEAIAIEAQKQGGLVNLLLTTDPISYSLFHDVPDEYLKMERTNYFKEWFKEIDVWIGLPTDENFEQVYKDVPEEKFAMIRKGNESFNNSLNDSKVRGVFVTYPSAYEAANAGLDFETFEKMQWAAVNADYSKIAAQAKKLESMLMRSKEVRITTPGGTDLTFSVNGRPCFINDGIVTAEDAQKPLIFQRMVSLPGGNISTTIIENSGKGKVLVTKDKCKYEPMRNISFEFKDGVMQNLKAGEGQACLTDVFSIQKGDYNKISGFSIGLNPALKVMQAGDQDFRWDSAAGMVYLSLGDNAIYGGQNKAEGNFSINFPLTDATVSIDGVVVVEKGALKM